MSDLIVPHGKEERLMPLLLEGSELKAEIDKAKTINHIQGNLRSHYAGDRGLHASDRIYDQGRLARCLR